MTVIRFRPRYDHDPGELKLVRVRYFLTEDRRRALRESDVKGVQAIDESLRTVGELLRTAKEALRQAA
jgi:hypothetical protein